MAEKIITRDISVDVKGSFLDYSMNVITDRALPDARDGCKPVHRRILFAMYETGNTCKKAYKKSARTVGEVLGKYHPHGDSSVYGAMVRMAQDFSLRYPLVDGHGNFGSIDGDGPAAMRYTEARMSKLADTMLEDIDKETVDMMRNYDETLDEPKVLPAKLPNLLVNGVDGIAVGFASNIPPHNITEVLNGIVAKIDNPALDSVGLMKYIKGPDFPTGGTIQGTSGILDMYTKSRGKIVVRADFVVENAPHGRKNLVFVNIPYQVNKEATISKIEQLCSAHIEKKDGKEIKVKAVIDDVTDIRDETSAKDGVRIVLELKKTANIKKIVAQLYKNTNLQNSYGAVMTALQPTANGGLRPHDFTLLELVDAYIGHRKDVVERKYKFLLRKAEERKHIIDGLIVAVNAIDEVVATIRQSKDKVVANENLCRKFHLDAVQASAILEYRLQSLTGLEVDKLMNELESIKKSIALFQHILSSDETIIAEVRKDCVDMLNQYGDERITHIKEAVNDDEYSGKDDSNIEDKEMVVTISDTGYIKSISLDEFSAQRRGGKGVKGVKAENTDNIKQMISTNKRNILLCFGSDGKSYRLPVASLEEVSRTARGQYINNIISAPNDVEIVAVIGVREKAEQGVILLFTERGQAKKIAVKEFMSSNYKCLLAVKINEDDRLINAVYSETESGIAYVATRNGKLLKFDYNHYRCKGRNSGTNKCINLSDGDYVVSADIITDDDSILTVTNTGIGKKSPASSYRLAGVGGMGVINYKTTQDVEVAAVLSVKETDDILVACDNGKLIRVHSDDFRDMSRGCRGTKLVNLEGAESVIGASTVVRDEKDLADGN